jgi:MFS family permease
MVLLAGSQYGDVVPECGGVWLMTHFTTSPVLIALMQTATTLPVFLVGLLAGALADIVNRRRLLLATQGLILLAASLAVLTYTGLMNAPLLLAFTFVLGLGAILGSPAWQAVNTDLVPSDELPAAVTLSSVSYNLARAVGPALARRCRPCSSAPSALSSSSAGCGRCCRCSSARTCAWAPWDTGCCSAASVWAQ